MAKQPPSSARLNPAALTPPQAARLLAQVSGKAIRPTMISRDVASGAPTNQDGTLNLAHYAAWLVREVGDAR